MFIFWNWKLIDYFVIQWVWYWYYATLGIINAKLIYCDLFRPVLVFLVFFPVWVGMSSSKERLLNLLGYTSLGGLKVRSGELTWVYISLSTCTHISNFVYLNAILQSFNDCYCIINSGKQTILNICVTGQIIILYIHSLLSL